jgi:hypothetical protein
MAKERASSRKRPIVTELVQYVLGMPELLAETTYRASRRQPKEVRMTDVVIVAAGRTVSSQARWRRSPPPTSART